jgi:transposase
MRKIREVLRLKWECKLSNRAVASSCNIGYGTVPEYTQRARTAGLSWPLPEDLDDDALEQKLYPDSDTVRLLPGVTRPEPDWEVVHGEMRRKGVTLRLLWIEYREGFPSGYGYSQYCELYSRWAGKLKPSMRFNHAAGEKCFVDYAGPTAQVIDPDTGEILKASIFVGVLGASSYTYAEAHFGQTVAHWLGAHARMFAFFGGVTQVLTPDNLKSGVKHPCRYEPDLNPTYQDFANHYGVAVVPARVRKPRDKAKVEVGVQVVERWILARLRHSTFFSLADLNQAIRLLLTDLNNRLMRGWNKSRRELFEALDRPTLRPLPERPYDELTVLVNAKVGIDYHVEFDKNFYSVPYQLLRQPVLVRATERTVEIFHKGCRIASHCRAQGERIFVTLAEHRPPAHRAYLEWSPDRFLRWAQKIGPSTTGIIQIRLNSKQHPEQSFRSCLGILGLSKKYGEDRLEAACTRAQSCGIYFYKGIKNILDNRYDQIEMQQSTKTSGIQHNNVRGNKYFH